MRPYDCVVRIGDELYEFVIGARDAGDAVGVCKFTAIHLGWARSVEDITSIETKRRPSMATEDKIQTFASFEKETKNSVRLTSGWGVIYVPKSQLEKLGDFDGNFKITVEKVTE